jgi:hypothetical protein
MKRVAEIVVLTTIMVLSVAATSAYLDARKPIPVAPPDYVVLISACDEPVGILITSQPPAFVSGDFPPSDAQQAAIDAAISTGRYSFLAIPCSAPKTRT